MAYSTGAGIYTALMSAVLAHAIADGWTTTGGNWPISKGNVRGVNWSTLTTSVTDFTGTSMVARTERLVLLAIGSSPSNATANASVDTNSVTIRNMEQTFSEWHIFSDPGVGKPDYIHVAARFSNGLDPNCWIHFSFGELDKGGMSYHSIAFAASTARRGYIAVAPSASTDTNASYDYNCATNNNWNGHFSGNLNIGINYRQPSNVRNLIVMVNGTLSPFPGSGGWPASDVPVNNESVLDLVWPHVDPVTDVAASLSNTGSLSFGMNAVASLLPSQPYSGGVSLQSIPLIITNGNILSSLGMILGTFPGVRHCSIDSFAEGQEVSYSTDIWKLFPLLRKTQWNQCQVRNVVSSGQAGISYLKVV